MAKGNKFTPTPQVNVYKLEEDVKDFIRRVRVQDFFSDATQVNDLNLKYQKSDFTPAKGNNAELDNLLEILECQSTKVLASTHVKKKNKNLSREEYDALNTLRNNSNLYITTADKGALW